MFKIASILPYEKVSSSSKQWKQRT